MMEMTLRRRRWCCEAGIRSGLVLAATVAAIVTLHADEIKVMTSGAFTAAHLALGPQFELRTENTVATVSTSMGTGAESIPNRIQRGEPVDVVILPEAALDSLVSAGLVLGDSRVALARSAIGLAVRAGRPKPDISTVDALRRTLLDAKSIAYSASVSGDYLTKELFPRLGIADQVHAKSRRIDRERVAAVVARGEAEIGFQQISELLPVRGAEYVGPLPPEVQRVTIIAAGITVRSKAPEAARAYIRFLASPAAAESIRRSGMDPLARP
ncbi:MAG: substrate-binding domain-containing protein [Acidobacteriota bacterium]